jgi:hypothetical protein
MAWRERSAPLLLQLRACCSPQRARSAAVQRSRHGAAHSGGEAAESALCAATSALALHLRRAHLSQQAWACVLRALCALATRLAAMSAAAARRLAATPRATPLVARHAGAARRLAPPPALRSRRARGAAAARCRGLSAADAAAACAQAAPRCAAAAAPRAAHLRQRCVRRQGARVCDNAHLLRERQAAHRARLRRAATTLSARPWC